MLQNLFSFLIDVIELIYAVHILNIVRREEKGSQRIIICLLLCLPGLILWEDIDWNTYLIKKVYLLLIPTFYLCKSRRKLGETISLLCILFSVCEALKMLAAVVGNVSMIVLFAGKLSSENMARVLMILFTVLFVKGTVDIIKNKIVTLKFSFSKKCMACLAYALVILGKIPFLYTGFQEARILKMVIITIICCTIIFFVISRIEHRNAEMERAKIEENNKNLSSKLHKSQEILPAVVQVLSDVAENNGKEMEGQETQELLNEMTTLFGQQLKENSKEDLQLKNFCSTGLKILDQQLKVYQMEAVDRGVNLDIYVQAPINDIIKWDDIDQLKLLRAVGDLVRNAFRITEKNKIIDRNGCEDKKCRANGHILLIIGCRYEGILEIAVVDNGEPFPLFVIEAFGRRGVTMGGTGNGLADLVEFAGETKASIGLEELDGKTNSFTKKISIIFDKQRKNYLKSYREELIKSSFWIKTEY